MGGTPEFTITGQSASGIGLYFTGIGWTSEREESLRYFSEHTAECQLVSIQELRRNRRDHTALHNIRILKIADSSGI